jgi:glycosyltransferase involved in cell wall biosynthesis
MFRVSVMSKIIFVSEYFNPDENSTGYYWYSLVNNISKKYSCVHVIAPKMSISNVFRDNKHIKTQSFFSFSFKSKNVLLRLFHQFHSMLQFSLKIILLAKENDVIVLGTNPALLVLVLPFLKKLIRFKVILLVHDVFPENLIPAGLINKNTYTYTLIKKYSDFSYGSVNLIIVIGRDMKNLIDKKVKENIKVVHISNWVNPLDVQLVLKSETSLIKDNGWQNKIVFQFFGNMGRLQGIPNILKAITLVDSLNVAYIFVGSGIMVDLVESFIENHPEIPMVYLNGKSLNKKNDVQSACDIAFVSLEKGMLGLGVPSKAYFSLAADKPLLVISDPESEVALMVVEEGVGWVVAPDSPSELAVLIDKICCINLSEMNGLQRALICNKYSDEIALRNFETCISEIMLQVEGY